MNSKDLSALALAAQTGYVSVSPVSPTPDGCIAEVQAEKLDKGGLLEWKKISRAWITPAGRDVLAEHLRGVQDNSDQFRGAANG